MNLKPINRWIRILYAMILTAGLYPAERQETHIRLLWKFYAEEDV